MRKNFIKPTRRWKKVFTLIELLVVIGIIAILLTILLPGLQKSREKVKQIACANNMKQLGTAFNLYTSDADSWLPPLFQNYNYNGYTWMHSLYPYLGINDLAVVGAKVFECPSHKYAWWFSETVHPYHSQPSYGANCRIIIYSWATGPHTDDALNQNPLIFHTKLERIKNPSKKLLLGESLTKYEGNNDNGICLGRSTSDPNKYAQARHDRSGNLLFIDGHVKGFTCQQLLEMQNTYNAHLQHWFPYTAN